jgi:hypothetical protein
VEGVIVVKDQCEHKDCDRPARVVWNGKALCWECFDKEHGPMLAERKRDPLTGCYEQEKKC